MAATLINTSDDKTITINKRIIIPKIREFEENANQIPESDIVKWHDMTTSDAVYQLKECDPKDYEAKLVFKPTSLCPWYELGSVIAQYKFNVGVFTHRDPDAGWIQHVVDRGPENTSGRPNFITVPCKEFLSLFKPVV